MNTIVSEIGTWQRRIEVELEEKEVQPFMEKAYRSYQKKIHIDGFRKGKVPLSIIKKRFGEAIRAEVADDLIQVFFKEAIEKEKLDTIAPGKVKEISFEEGKPFRFSAEVEIEPDVGVSDYKGFKVEKEVIKITQEDVKKTLEFLQEQKAEKREVEGGAEMGYIIEGDIQALDTTGVPIVGEKWENSVIELGSPPLGDIVQDQLLGAVAGGEKRFKIVQPESEADGAVKDRESHYAIQVKSVKEKILPELNDDFAKTVGDYQTLSELEENILKNIKARREADAERLLHQRIADEIVKRNDFEVPPSMVENVLQSSWEEYKQRPDRNVDEDQFREENRPSVVWSVKWHILEKKLMEMENIEVTEQRVNDEITKMVEASPKEEKKIRAQLKDAKRRQRLKENISQRKLMERLKEHLKIKEVVVKSPMERKSKIIT